MRNCCADGQGHGGRPRWQAAGARADNESTRRTTPAHQAPLVWRVPEGLDGLAAVPVGGGGAWPQHPRVTAITTPEKVAHNFRRSFFETAQKRCNSNEVISMFEQVTRELRAKLLRRRQDHAQPNVACNSPTTRTNTNSKTAEYQRLDFNT